MHTPMLLEQPKKTFSLQEANRSLIYIERVVQDVVDVYSCIMALRRRMDIQPGDAIDASPVAKEYDQAMTRLGVLVDELNGVGVELRDFELGVVDFPGLVGGKEVCWCWRLGETEVITWHGPEEGFMRRQPVAALAG